MEHVSQTQTVFSVHLSLSLSNEGEIKAVYTFKNVTPHETWLLKSFAETTYTNNLFKVFCNGVKAEYIGTMIKKTKPAIDDFILFNPGMELTAKSILSRGYDLTDCKNITVQFYGFNPSFSGQDLFKIESNIAILSNP